MSRAAGDRIPSSERFHRVLHQRRSNTRGPAKVLQQVIGLDAKLKQYEQGERFIDAVEAYGGPELLRRAWTGPEFLPSLPEVRERYGLEVSSPGPERPLSKPDHFRRYLGRRARVRTRGPHDGHSSFTGELLGATDDAVTVAADTGVVSIAYAEIQRSNLVGD